MRHASPASEAPHRTEFLGLDFDCLDTQTALDWIAGRSADSPLAYVITPNVDHMVRLSGLGPDLRRAYAQADLCLCDSRVLARLARAVGVTLPVAPGSDITKALFERVLAPGDTVCLIGGTSAHLDRLTALYPRLRIVQHLPPMGLLHDPAARAAAIAAAEAAAARITLIGVGSPQQELIAFEMRRAGRTKGTALCIGASVDFLAGNERRAPSAVQKAGMEWAWRLAANPRRLAKRYLVDGPAIFPLVWRWARGRRRG
jgi:N-acetylglucosaminyldiphosphoundecaprenol N-acetyl-beta-D-mannosaminyltransferase